MRHFSRALSPVTFLALAALAASPAAAWWGECDQKAPRAAAIAADGISKVRVVALAGDLTITGKKGQSRIEASGTACADEAALLAKIELKVERRGSEVVVEVEIPDHNGNAGLDLAVAVPEGVALEVDDTSGDTTIYGVAAVEIADNSGDLQIEKIAGNVDVDDNSGDVEIRFAQGTVRVRDGSGDVRITDAGEVEIENDGSGELVIEKIARNVRIDEDGSGDIRVATVGGNLQVDDDGSGDLSYDGVKGRVDVPSRD